MGEAGKNLLPIQIRGIGGPRQSFQDALLLGWLKARPEIRNDVIKVSAATPC